MIEFIITWIGLYCLVVWTMFNDNICWISSSPEFPEVKKKRFKDYLIYCLRDRIFAVIKDYRDIIPAIFSSLALTVAIRINVLYGIGLLFLSTAITMLIVKLQKARDW